MIPLLKKLFCLFLLITLSSTGCEKNTDKDTLAFFHNFSKTKYYKSDVILELNQTFYGKWELLSISGGFAGSGHKKNFDYFLLKQYGIYGLLRNDSIVEFGKIVVEKQNEEELLINLQPDLESDTVFFDSEKYVNFFKGDTMAFHAPCCDRYNYHFKKTE